MKRVKDYKGQSHTVDSALTDQGGSGGQRAKETVGGTLEFAEFETAVKGPEDISVKGEGSEDLTAR